MKPIHRYLSVFTFVLLAAVGAAGYFRVAQATSDARPTRQTRERDAARTPLSQSYGRLPMRFEANRGQTDGRVRFVARGDGYALFLTPSEAVLRLRRADRNVEPAILRMRLAGANPRPRVSGVERLPTASNYFVGADPRAWRTNVANFASVKYEAVYPGVDLVWYGNQQQLEHDFIVAPGADPKQIKLSFAGAGAITIDAEGALALRVGGEEVRLLKPVAWQEADGERREIRCDYRVTKNNLVEFRLGAYDPKLPLVIDPVLVYSTYLGGTGFDYGLDIAVDGEGAAYITGQTDSADFPGASTIQSAKGTQFDAYVLKVNPAGNAVVFATWLGGNGADSGSGIAVDAGGAVYVTGSTNSSNFPLQSALQTSRKGASDAFVAKLNAAGTALLYSTYLGGGGTDGAGAVAVDGGGNAYLTGSTDSGDFPLAGAFQSAKRGSGAYASANAGENWSEIGAGLGGADVNDLAIDPNNSSTLYAGTDRGVFKSADKGATWNLLGGDSFIRNINQVVVDPVTPTTLYAVSLNQLFKSLDGGASWVAKPLSLVWTVAIDPAAPATLYAGTINGLQKSADGGESWAPVAIPPTGGGGAIGQVDAIAVDPVNPATVYVGANRGLYKSVNGGANWTFASNGLPFFSTIRFSRIAISRSSPTTLYALIGDATVYKTTDSGGNWVQLNVPSLGVAFSQIPLPLAVAPNSADVVYVGSRSFGVYKSADGGATWGAINNGLNATEIRALAVDRNSPNTVYAGADSGTEAFVAKLNPAGSALVYSSYLGGGGSESGSGIAVDASGNAYLAGSTTSPNFPVVNAFQSAIGGQTDAFVAKINASGSAVLWASYLGGSNFDAANGVAVNAAGNLFVAGATASNNFPRERAIQASLKGQQDAFVARFSADGARLDFSTYLGGAGFDLANAVALDAAGSAYVTGQTDSSDFPVVSAVQPARGGDPNINNSDAFVTKLNADGSALAYSTYLGGGGFDQGHGIAVDAAANAYVTGLTTSNDFPTTPNPIRAMGTNDAFLAKLGISADLALAVSDLPDPVMVNNQLTYTLTVANHGPDPAVGVTVTNTLPGGVTFVSATASQGSCLGTSAVNCNVGALAPNTGATITIIVTPSAAGTITNRASVTSGTPDLNPANNSATQETKVSTLPSIYGRVTTAGGSGLSGVNVALTGAQRPAVVTDVDGGYQFSELADGGNYTVTPSRQGYVFNPPNRAFNNLSADQRADFSAVACVFTISQRSQSFPATGGTGSVTITGPDPQCAWTARSNAPWIRLTSAASGNGSGMLSFAVDPAVGSRNGTITIAGNTFTVFQEFNACAEVNFPATPIIQLPREDYGHRILVRDFNRDSRADLVAITVASGKRGLSLFPGASDGKFGAPVPALSLQGDRAFVLSIVAGDFNNDGNPDLAAITEDNPGAWSVWWVLNNGAGGFAAPQSQNTDEAVQDLAVGDFNGDGRQDLVVAVAGATTEALLFFNHGAGGFGQPQKLPRGGGLPTPSPYKVETADLDGDGKLDLLFFQRGPEVTIYKGDGSGGFTAQPFLILPFTQSSATGDFNGDGRTDIFFVGVTNGAEELVVYLNDGTGRFGEPVKTPARQNFPLTQGAVAGDFNGDGKTDVVLRTANQTNNRDEGIRLFTASGNGRFNDLVIYLPSLVSAATATGDYNRDGLPDIFSLNGIGWLTVVSTQAGGFNAPRGFNFLPPGASSQSSVAAAEAGDLNGDGVIDLAVASFGSDRISLLFGNGRGEFGPPVPLDSNGNTGVGGSALALRDFNRDGKLDLAVVNSNTQNLVVLLGAGRGEFAVSATLNIGANAFGLAAADFNRDGNLDLVAKGQSSGLTLFTGDGQGGFTPSASGIGGNLFNLTFASGDFNGDGNPDLALFDDAQSQTPEGYKLVILPGNGQGGFGAPINVTTEDRPIFLRAADLNFDGRDDLIYAHSYIGNAVYVALSNPAGGFAAPVRYPTGSSTRSVVVRDINGDGKPDLVAASQETGSITILLGKGDGSFNPPVNLPVFDSPTLVLAEDFDEDGAVDLAIPRGFSLVGVLPNRASCAPAGSAVPVSSASYARHRVAAESIVALFGANLAATTQVATTIPLPTTLANTSVKVKDGAGVERLSPLFFVSPGQINHLIPAGTAPGAALLTVMSGNNVAATGTTMIAATAPGLFSADASGQGVAAAVALRVKADGSQVFEPVASFDAAQNRFVAVPIDLSNASEQVFLLLFGTGLRNHTALANVGVKIGGETVEVLYAGSQGGFAGLDQMNLRLPRSLQGRGEVDVLVSVDGRAANTVRINAK